MKEASGWAVTLACAWLLLLLLVVVVLAVGGAYAEDRKQSEVSKHGWR